MSFDIFKYKGLTSCERFKQQDIERFENELKELNLGCDKFFKLKGLKQDKEVEHIKIPTNLFKVYLLHCSKYKLPGIDDYEKAYDLFMNLELNVYKLERGNNPFLEKTNYLGMANKTSIDLYLDAEANHSVVSLMWILAHEFRHVLQNNFDYISSCLYNENYELWKNYMCQFLRITEEEFLHVFHEILPFEVDANTWACEFLRIDYPSSKFAINKEIMEKLNV